MRDRSPTFKLFLAGVIGVVLMFPLLLVYALVTDRQHQARVAHDTITAGSGAAQVVSGPVLAIPYTVQQQVVEQVNGQQVRRAEAVRRELFVSPSMHSVSTSLEPERKRKAIYETVIYTAQMKGKARFELPADLSNYGVTYNQLLLDEAQIRFGISDPRGLRAAANVRVDGQQISLKPGQGTAASGGAGFHGQVGLSAGEPLDVSYSYSIRGSRSLSFVPRGDRTEWRVSSPWQHPGFGGDFLPDNSKVSGTGFSATWSIGKLALGQSTVASEDFGPPQAAVEEGEIAYQSAAPATNSGQVSKAATIALIELVDIYSQVDRSVKYGFLFIGFTFLAFLLFDVVGGARVAAAEYLLTGAGLVLFFVLLLAFAEVLGFALAYAIASAAIIGLLTAYSAAVLGGWRRAGFIGGLLAVLYTGLYVLLSLEAASLIVGSLLMFFALAAVMYTTRNIEWSSIDDDAVLPNS